VNNRLKLSPEIQAKIYAWHDAKVALGTYKEALKRAADEHRAKVRALGRAKQKAFELGVPQRTFQEYYIRRQRALKGLPAASRYRPKSAETTHGFQSAAAQGR